MNVHEVDPLVDFNDTAELYAPARGIHELFEVWADKTPDAVAVRFEQEALTYEALNRKANRLAHHLRELGVRPDVPVGLCVRRSLDLTVGVLGISKAGGACMPLDPACSPEWLAWVLDASGARVLLTQRPLQETLPQSEARRLYLDADEGVWAGHSEANPWPLSGSGALAYVLYTSGSARGPEGVAMHHRPLLNLLRWQVARSAAPKARTTPQLSAPDRGVFFQELFSTWAAGGALVLIPEAPRLEARALLEVMDGTGVERVFLPFLALRDLAEVADRDGLAPRGLREIITAGARPRLTPALRRLMTRLDGCVLELQYSPPEAPVAMAHRLEGDPEEWPEWPGLGKPIANTRVHLLDGDLEPVPVGRLGELCIGGAAVARGYLHRLELTRERFIEDPFAVVPGRRLYRTGDLARFLPDGRLELLGLKREAR